jgi:DNA invertase Pin-like site-specific DNA recombinase
MAKYGYARISCFSQLADIQAEAFTQAGCTIVRTEKVSGRSTEGRDELATILDFMSKGDVLFVHKIDRIGRNTRDVLNLVHTITAKGCLLQVLRASYGYGRSYGNYDAHCAGYWVWCQR